jgi:hypothetical protein
MTNDVPTAAAAAAADDDGGGDADATVKLKVYCTSTPSSCDFPGLHITQGSEKKRNIAPVLLLPVLLKAYISEVCQ